MDIIMKPGDEVTGHIRWEQPVLTLYGYVAGETGVATFIAHCPEASDISGPWVLTSALPGQREWRLSGDQPEALRQAAEAWVAEFVSSLGASFPEEPGEPEKPRGKPRTELDGYRPYHAADCPARTSYHGHECTCGGLEHPLWKPGDEPSVHAEPVPPHPEEEAGR